jgi:hypothetical protein
VTISASRGGYETNISAKIDFLHKKYCDYKRNLCRLSENGSLSEVTREFNIGFDILFELGQIGEKSRSLKVRRWRSCAKKYLNDNFSMNYHIDSLDDSLDECEKLIETLLYVTFEPVIQEMESAELDDIRDVVEADGDEIADENIRLCIEKHMSKSTLMKSILKVMMFSELNPNGHQIAIGRKDYVDHNMIAFESYKKCYNFHG